MDTQTNIIPYRENRAVKSYSAAPIIDVSGEGLPTEHPVGSYIAGLQAVRSREAMLSALASVLCVMEEKKQLGEVDWETARYYHRQVWEVDWAGTKRPWMKALYVRLERVGYAPRSRMKLITAVRGVLKECRFMGLMDPESYFQCTEGFPAIKDDSEPTGRAVGLDEVVELLRFCDADKNRARGVRDAAIVSIGWSAGPRACEMVALTTGDYSKQNGTLSLNGKGNKKMKVPIGPLAQERLDEWLEVRGKTPGRIFCQVDLAGNVLIRSLKTGIRRLKPLTRPDAINKLLQLRINEARLPEPFSFHDFRRTAATEISKNHGIELAQALLRHASITTTVRYRRLDQTELKAAMADRDQRLREALEEGHDG